LLTGYSLQALVAKEMAEVCERIGFFAVKNHGVPDEVIEKTWGKTRQVDACIHMNGRAVAAIAVI